MFLFIMPHTTHSWKSLRRKILFSIPFSIQVLFLLTSFTPLIRFVLTVCVRPCVVTAAILTSSDQQPQLWYFSDRRCEPRTAVSFPQSHKQCQYHSPLSTNAGLITSNLPYLFLFRLFDVQYFLMILLNNHSWVQCL